MRSLLSVGEAHASLTSFFFADGVQRDTRRHRLIEFASPTSTYMTIGRLPRDRAEDADPVVLVVPSRPVPAKCPLFRRRWVDQLPPAGAADAFSTQAEVGSQVVTDTRCGARSP